MSPQQAMALAGTQSRDKETLYSIALKFAHDEGVDLQDLLRDLEHRFHSYA